MVCLSVVSVTRIGIFQRSDRLSARLSLLLIKISQILLSTKFLVKLTSAGWCNTILRNKDEKLVGTLSVGKDVTEGAQAFKRLLCLCNISDLAETADLPLEKVLQRIVNLLPNAWQYPEIARARIVIENQEFTTNDLSETQWRQRADIKANETGIGFVEVAYLEEKPQATEGPFLKEERDLINEVAERLGKIIQRVRAEQSSKEDKERFKALFTENPVAAVYVNSNFHILDINPRFEDLFGYSLAEIKGKHIDEVVVQDENTKEAETLNRKAFEGYVYHDTVRKRKDSSFVNVSISAAPITIESRLIGYIGMYRDISELKKSEKKLAMMNEKLRVVGGLTRHDVRNKLSIITLSLFLTKDKVADRLGVVKSYEDIRTACDQIVEIFDFANDYERLGVEELGYVNAEDAIRRAVSLQDLKGVTVSIEFQGLAVLADSLLRQLFYNLIDNSLKHGDHVTHIKISIQKSEKDLKLICEDDGAGIPKETKPKLFCEGFTTGKGTGYGLYLIKKITEVYGWTIHETGTPEKGAQFTITIPKLNEQGKENYRLSQR
jgi:PAS domain S-box-containing protein